MDTSLSSTESRKERRQRLKVEKKDRKEKEKEEKKKLKDQKKKEKEELKLKKKQEKEEKKEKKRLEKEQKRSQSKRRRETVIAAPAKEPKQSNDEASLGQGSAEAKVRSATFTTSVSPKKSFGEEDDVRPTKNEDEGAKSPKNENESVASLKSEPEVESPPEADEGKGKTKEDPTPSPQTVETDDTKPTPSEDKAAPGEAAVQASGEEKAPTTEPTEQPSEKHDEEEQAKKLAEEKAKAEAEERRERERARAEEEERRRAAEKEAMEESERRLRQQQEQQQRERQERERQQRAQQEEEERRRQEAEKQSQEQAPIASLKSQRSDVDAALEELRRVEQEVLGASQQMSAIADSTDQAEQSEQERMRAQREQEEQRLAAAAAEAEAERQRREAEAEVERQQKEAEAEAEKQQKEDEAERQRKVAEEQQAKQREQEELQRAAEAELQAKQIAEASVAAASAAEPSEPKQEEAVAVQPTVTEQAVPIKEEPAPVESQPQEQAREVAQTTEAPTAVSAGVDTQEKKAGSSRDKRKTFAGSSSKKQTQTPVLPLEAPATVPASAPERRRANTGASGQGKGVAARWQQAMDANLSAKNQNLTDKADERVVKGVQWMDTQIRMLISEIQKHGQIKDEKPTVTFGVLFAATIDSMPALAGAIATAKKRGVVAYEGDMLLQTVHDNVEITLIKDVIEDSPLEPSPRRRVTVTAGHSQSEPVLSNNERCVACGKIAYPLERAVASGKVFHKNCFKCSVCKCILKVIDYAHLDGTFYCQTHFQQLFLMNGDYKAGFNKAAEAASGL